MLKDRFVLGVGSLVAITIVVGAFLSSVNVSADDSNIDDVAVSVPVSCSMSGSGMTTHNATIPNGTFQSDIGITTLKAYCNDNEGFAIYAIGYTDDTDGKNVLSNGALGSIYDVITGTATSGNTSNWAMKLSTITSPTPTYPITIENGFDSYHVVPNDFVKVAKRNSATDLGSSAEGSTLIATYQAYISPTQLAGTYNGKVKYLLTHPNYADKSVFNDAVTVVFDGNGETFPNGTTTNTVKYANICRPGDYAYVGNTYQEVMTSNILTGGIQNGSYTDHENILQTINLPNADKVKVVVDYGITGSTLGASFVEGIWDGDWSTLNDHDYYEIYDSNNISGTREYILNSNTVTIYVEGWDVPEIDYNYGFYAKIYPVYNTEQPNTTIEELPSDDCFVTSVSGSYMETSNWKNGWVIDDEGYIIKLSDEADVIRYISDNYGYMKGGSLSAIPSNPYIVNYDGNNATVGTMDGFNHEFDVYDNSERFYLIVPNFKKDGYGFAGWSINQNATVNGSSKIYGPNESVQFTELFPSDNIHEVTLYAVWVQSTDTMQNWNGCSSLSIGQVLALTDIRDNNVYTIGRMQDGNCWMMENLRLDAVDSSDNTKAQGFGGIFTGLADSEDGNFDSNTANSKYSTSNIGDGAKERFPRYNNNNTNFGGVNSNGVTLVAFPECSGVYCESNYLNNSSDHAQWYGYGNYYTWAAAMANTNNFVSIVDSEAANTSICPNGWSLPYGNITGAGINSGGFSYLDVQMGGTGASSGWDEGEEISNNWRSYPNNFVVSGEWTTSAWERGTFGLYWSRTSSTNSTAWGFGLSANYVVFDDYNKTNASPIRCIKLNI